MTWTDFIAVLQRLQEGWGAKIGISIACMVAVQDHAQIFVAFFALVCADLATKWLALSRQYLADSGHPAPTLWQALWHMRAARHAGYIRSDAMRTRFVHKMLTYVAVVAAAALLDFILLKTHAPTFAVTIVVGYLALTEFVSILENIQKSGIEEAGALVEMIRRRGGLGTDKKQDNERRNDK